MADVEFVPPDTALLLAAVSMRARKWRFLVFEECLTSFGPAVVLEAVFFTVALLG